MSTDSGNRKYQALALGTSYALGTFNDNFFKALSYAKGKWALTRNGKRVDRGSFDIPETRAFMHLDTVFTMVDYDKFTIHPEIEGPLSVYEMTLDDHGELQFRALKEELKRRYDIEITDEML